MKLTIDCDQNTLTVETTDGREICSLYSDRAFELLSEQWIKTGWNQRYPYTFSWFGRPIIQLPEDLIRTQEVIYRLRPEVILETGVAYGGSLVYYASLCKAMGIGRVIGIDIEIRPHNRAAIEEHELAPFITLIEGDSTSPATVAAARSLIEPGEAVLVLLDSNHTKHHVLDELIAYHDFVTPGSYIVATDGVMKNLHDVPRGQPEWSWDNPTDAAIEFVSDNPDFVIEQPAWPFNESGLGRNVTHWPGAWIRRTSPGSSS